MEFFEMVKGERIFHPWGKIFGLKLRLLSLTLGQSIVKGLINLPGQA